MQSVSIWREHEHLTAVTALLNVITAVDHLKYAKTVVTYLSEMKAFPQAAPEVAEEFQQGNFVVKRACGSYNGICTDMALECSQKCHAKCKTGQAGLKGVTMTIILHKRNGFCLCRLLQLLHKRLRLCFTQMILTCNIMKITKPLSPGKLNSEKE